MTKTSWFLIFFLSCSLSGSTQSSTAEYYALTRYHIRDKAQEAKVDRYLKEAYLPAMHRLGKKNIGVFKPIPSDTAAFGKIIYVLTVFQSLEEYANHTHMLLKDVRWKNASEAYWNSSHTEPPYHRIEITLMHAFSDMPTMRAPSLTGAKADRIYELRSYEGSTEQLYLQKVKMFNEGGEIALFERLGFNAVFYAEVLAGARMPNLIYMTTFENSVSRDAHWKAFSADDEWKKLLTIEEYKNTVSKADVWLLFPTEYSDY